MMKKSLIIDFKLLNKLEISYTSFLFLYNLYRNETIFNIDISEQDIDNLEKKKYIKIISSNKAQLRNSAIELIELLLIEVENQVNKKKSIKKSDRLILKDIEDNLNEYRGKWKGLKPGSMGSLKACRDKLFRWLKENPEYTMKDVLRAADIYINSINNITYLQQADYFIFKQANNREESSRLSAFIDEGELIDDNWTNTLK